MTGFFLAQSSPVMRSLVICVVLVYSTTAFLFPGGGGGGGCGCGCEDTSCLPKPPKIGCTKLCFSVPTIKLPCPSLPSCGCGGRKKREVIGDEKCSIPEMTDVIIHSLRNNPKESRDNILAELKEKFTEHRYLVSCVDGKTDFKTSATNFCSAGTAEQTCFVVQAEEQA